jgi:hypothetical protein
VNKTQIKNIAYFIGKTLGVLGLLYVFYKLYQEYTWESFLSQLDILLPTLPLLIMLNLFSLLLGIYAWCMMLQHYSAERLNYRTAYYYFSKTEISKYLPGNIFHFVGRQALASRIGISQKQMAKISLLHSLLLLSATVLSSTFFALFSPDIPGYILTLMGLSCIIALVVTAYMYPSFPIGKKNMMNLYLSISIAFQGVMLAVIIYVLQDDMSLGLFFECTGIYIISWLIGFATPGASGGLGVREGAFIAISAFLHIDISTEIIIFSVLLVRFINILVDMLMYLSTFVLKNNIKGLES